MQFDTDVLYIVYSQQIKLRNSTSAVVLAASAGFHHLYHCVFPLSIPAFISLVMMSISSHTERQGVTDTRKASVGWSL